MCPGPGDPVIQESHRPLGTQPWGRESFSENEKEDRGFWGEMGEISRAVLFHPAYLFRTMIPAKGMKESLSFGLLYGSLGAMFGGFWQFLILWGNLASLGDYLLGRYTMILLFIGFMTLLPFLVVMGMLCMTGVLHASLWILRGAKKGLGATFKVMAYSQTTEIFQIIPFVGSVAGWIWQLIIRIIGLKEIHGTTYPRVILAFLIPWAALLCMALAIIVPLFLLD